MKTNFLVSTLLWLMVVSVACVISYKIGLYKQRVADASSTLGFHVSSRYKLSTGDVEGVNKDLKTAILFFTFETDFLLNKPYISSSDKRALESMLLRVAKLERDYPLLVDGFAKDWDAGRIAYSNALKRIESKHKNAKSR